MSKKRAPSKRNKRRAKDRARIVDKSKMNDGGFYEGMPGAHLEYYHETIKEKGKKPVKVKKSMRKFITFVVTEDGDAKAQIFCDPQLIKAAMREAALDNVMVRQIVVGAAVDIIFEKKTPWYMFIRFMYKRWFKAKQRRVEAAKADEMRKIMNSKLKESPEPGDSK